ncbi:uncharacterized protein JCM6883_001566 [Sporobolomyces salmoneus]|uniref:uncharacterized protein n=1 Tax=Sporobolomyces salmoneus TaxID=183962 RepID=UPI0031784506
MSTPEILYSSSPPENDVKRTHSTEDDTKSFNEAEVEPTKSLEGEEPAPVKATPKALDVLLGRDRTTLREDPIIWTQGVRPFTQSLARRLRNIFSVRFLFCLACGQALSLCITATSTLTTELGMNGWAMPTFQTFFVYLFLNVFYTSYTIYRYGFKVWGRMILTDGWKYFILAAVDVEANFLVVKAYGYTSLLSCMLLDAWATPACMIFAFFLVKARYHWTQVLGVLICIGGLGLLVASDFITDKDYPASARVKGDIFMLIGATGYGLSNALEEFFVRQRPLYEIVGQMGFWGMFINGIQGAGLEHHLFHTVTWNGTIIGCLIGYVCAMLFLYSLAPILFRLSSSPFYNLSILTSDFFGLLIGLRVFGYHPYWLYFVAFPIVLVGLVVYFCAARPESLEINVVARGKQAEKEAKNGKRVIGENNA